MRRSAICIATTSAGGTARGRAAVHGLDWFWWWNSAYYLDIETHTNIVLSINSSTTLVNININICTHY